MMQRSEGATALVAMPGFVVGAQVEVDGEWWLHVETTLDVVGCVECGTRGVGHGRRRVKVRDLPIVGRPVVLVWSKRIWRCPEPACGSSTWSETSEAMAARSGLTQRARAQICRRVGEEEDSVAALAREFGVGWHTAMAAVRDHGRPLVEDPARLDDIGALGLDETVFLHAGPRRRTTYVTGFVDLHRARLLDVRPGRSGKAVSDWLDERGDDWLHEISVVALDPFRGYANGLLSRLDHATVVLDHSHAVRLANEANAVPASSDIRPAGAGRPPSVAIAPGPGDRTGPWAGGRSCPPPVDFTPSWPNWWRAEWPITSTASVATWSCLTRRSSC